MPCPIEFKKLKMIYLTIIDLSEMFLRWNSAWKKSNADV